MLMSFKGCYFVTNCQKWMLNNPKLDVVNTNASAKFGHSPFILTQDIEWKRNSDVIQGPYSTALMYSAIKCPFKRKVLLATIRIGGYPEQ